MSTFRYVRPNRGLVEFKARLDHVGDMPCTFSFAGCKNRAERRRRAAGTRRKGR